MNNRLTLKNRIIVASTLFGMFFGAGNLIFPVHLGQLAGSNCGPAMIGFILSAVGLPIAAVAAIGISKADGLFGLTSRLSKPFGYVFTCVLYLTIGPLFAIPRCATVSFTTGILPMLGDEDPTISLLIFSFIFFVVVMFFSLRPNKISTWIGKIINPLFLVFLAFLIIYALLNPTQPIDQATPSGNYSNAAFFNGFIEGYGTMDAIAGLAFGVVVVDIIKNMGVKGESNIAKDVSKSGIYTGIVMGIIYALTIVVGAQSTGAFPVSENGGIALTQLANYYFGPVGNIILAITITLACLKTSIGLVASCSDTFAEMFPKKLNYSKWAIIFVAFSFVASNFGLTAIINYSIPVLNFLYSLCIVLICLTLISKLFNNYKPVYVITLIFTLIPAIFEFLKTLPDEAVNALNLTPLVEHYVENVPLASLSLSWIIPALVGFAIGMIVYFVKGRK